MLFISYHKQPISIEYLPKLLAIIGSSIFGKILEICVEFIIFFCSRFHSIMYDRVQNILVLEYHLIQIKFFITKCRYLGHFYDIISWILKSSHFTPKVCSYIALNFTVYRALIYLVSFLKQEKSVKGLENFT